ncbi:MAG: sulfurtransferase TusA family protein [Alphaproteobacteria bacterium]|nr:sulfurtransferase TusA family protein [Alphaproteobacteria bacterium]
MTDREELATRRLDVRGLRCPMPVLRAEAALRRLSPGDMIEVLADDPIAAVDIPHFCSEAGHAVERLADEGDCCVFQVTRG